MISDTRYWTVLSSQHSVKNLGDFYTAELTRRGWKNTSKVMSAKTATLVARLGAHGATISIMVCV